MCHSLFFFVRFVSLLRLVLTRIRKLRATFPFLTSVVALLIGCRLRSHGARGDSKVSDGGVPSRSMILAVNMDRTSDPSYVMSSFIPILVQVGFCWGLQKYQ